MIIPVEPKSSRFNKKNARLILKGALVALAALVISVSLIILLLGRYVYAQLSIFSSTSGMSFEEIKTTALTFYEQTKKPLTEPETLLILGVDKLDTRQGAPVLTDTILLATVDFSETSITLLPIPRDLWSEAYKTRINTLYHYANEQEKPNPEKFVAETLSEMTGVPINYSIIIEMNELSKLIDLVGGVEIDVQDGFIDEQFPRTDVDVTKVTDPKLLYKTVEFNEGVQTMNGERALEYIRSRKSSGTQGNDLARSQRQQQVIMALFSKIKDFRKLLNPSYSGSLVKYYDQNFSKYLPIEKLTHYVASQGKKISNLTFKNAIMTVYPEDENGILFHPSPRLYNEQWLYVIRDETKFKEYVLLHLGLKQADETTDETTNESEK